MASSARIPLSTPRFPRDARERGVARPTLSNPEELRTGGMAPTHPGAAHSGVSLFSAEICERPFCSSKLIPGEYGGDSHEP